MVFSPSKIPTNMYQLAFALGSQIINKPQKIPKPEKAKYVLFYTDGDRLYEFPLVCIYCYCVATCPVSKAKVAAIGAESEVVS